MIERKKQPDYQVKVFKKGALIKRVTMLDFNNYKVKKKQ